MSLDPNVASALRNAVASNNWQAFQPEAASALRSAMQTGDWRAFDQETAQAIQSELASSQNDPWAQIDPAVADALKHVVDHEFNKTFGPLQKSIANREADLDFRRDEDRLRAIYGDAYTKNRAKILEFAVNGGIGNVEDALHAWRGSQGLGPMSASETGPERANAEDPAASRISELNAKIEQLDGKYDSASELKRQKLKWELNDLLDEQGVAILKGANDPDQGRRDLIHTENDAKARRNAERTRAISRGYTDQTSRESKDGRNARLDREALDLLQGRTQPPKPQKKSSAERAAEAAGLDEIDRKALELMHSQSGDSEVSPSNGEAIVQQIVHSMESGN